MKNLLLILGAFFLLSTSASPQFTFYLIDNFEDANFNENPKWWRFGDIKAGVKRSPEPQARDLIAASCGEYSLNLSGKTDNWYIGGIGTDLGVDGSRYSRFQIDVYGDSQHFGKLKIELFDDDNQNYSIEQDPHKNYEAVYDDKWIAEVFVQGKGFTRVSIPFSAFRDANPGVGDDVWNPSQKNGSGGLLKLQLVVITEKQKGGINCNIDNLLITY